MPFLACLLALPAHAQPPAPTVAGLVTLQPASQPVPNAIVYLGGQLPALTGDRQPALVDAQNGRLSPRVQIATSGAVLVLQNSDPVLRVVRVEEIGGESKPRVLRRVAMPYAGFEKRFSLPTVTETRLLRVLGENGDEGQVAYLAVFPHTQATLTDAHGRFRIAGAAAGQYPIYVWQEVLGTLTGRVTVPRTGEVTVEFQFPRGWSGPGK